MSELQLKVALKDNATGGLEKLKHNVKGFADDFKKATPHVEGTTASILRLATGVAVGNLAVLALRKTIQELGQQFTLTTQAASTMQSALIGLSSVSAAFGESQLEARDAAMSLSEDGLMSVTESAEGLKNLLATGFNLGESIELMDAFKDAAAFNRQGTLEFGQAIVGATQGIKNQNSIMVDNVGITKNLSVIAKEAGLKMEDLGRIASDTGLRQKFLNGILDEAAVFAGDAARAADTFQGAQSRLRTSIFNLRASIGSALLPALTLLLNAFADNAKSINDVIGPALERLAIKLVKAVTFLRQLGASAVAVGKSIFTLSTQPLRELGDTLENISDQGVDAIKRIQTEGLKGFTDVARDALDRTTSMVSEAAKKIREAIEKENERFQLSLAKQARQFEESLKDMVIGHREKTADLEKDIENENVTHKERLAERVEDFAKSMRLIEERHKERVERIEDQIAKEEKSLEDAIEKIIDKNKDQMEQFKIAGQERLNDLTRRLDTEIAKGKLSNAKKVKDLTDMLAKEKIALEDQTKVREEIIQKDIENEKDSRQERIDDLQEELDDENVAVIEAREEKETEYEKETNKIKNEHQKRLASLVEQLNAEKEIQKLHSEDFARFQDAVREDDIARLKRKFAEERKLNEENHQRKLRDIAKRAQEEAATMQAAQVRSDQSSLAQANQQAQQATQNVQQTGQQLSDAINSSVDIPSSFNAPPVSGGSAQPTSGGGGFISNLVTGITNIGKNIYSGIKGFFGFQHGGEFTVGGQGGPDSQLVAFKATPGEKVIVNQPGESRQGITLNMPVQVVSSEVDVDLIAEKMMFNLNKEGLL